MKKIYKSVLFAIIAAAGFTACSDYEAPDITTESAITITGHETSFPASASTGSITFEAKGLVTVTANNEWITATVDGNRIDITVDQNNALTGRSGTITVKCGNATDNISIIQSGIIFKYDKIEPISINSDAWTQSYNADATVPIEVSDDADWINTSIADNKITIAIEANMTLIPRSATITVKCGDLEYSIPVEQEELKFPLFKIQTLRVNDSQSTKTYEFKADIPVKFTTEADWVQADFANNTVSIATEANTTGRIRNATLNYEIAGEAGSLVIVQAEFDKEIAGDFHLTFYDYFKEMELTILPAKLSRNGKNYTLTVTDIYFTGQPVLTIPVEYNDETLSVTISSGSTSIGMFQNYYCFLSPVTMGSDDIALYYTRDQKMNAAFVSTVSSDGTEGLIGQFASVSTNRLNLIGYGIGCFSSNSELSDDTAQGNLEIMINPSLLRIYSAEDAASTDAAKAAARTIKRKAANIPFKISPDSAKKFRRIEL